MDEHMVVLKGRVWDLNANFVDDNLNNLSWWTQKHVGYAIREAAQLLDQEYGLSSPKEQCGSLSGQTLKKRAMKTHVRPASPFLARIRLLLLPLHPALRLS